MASMVCNYWQSAVPYASFPLCAAMVAQDIIVATLSIMQAYIYLQAALYCKVATTLGYMAKASAAIAKRLVEVQIQAGDM